MKYSKNRKPRVKKPRVKIQKGSGIIKPGEMGICDLCYEEKIMVSAFNCNPGEPKETRALHTYCVDCVNSWIEAEPKNGAPLEISMREKKCPECRAPIKKEYVEGLIRHLPHAAEDVDEEQLVHFRPLSPSSHQISVLDPILFTGAVISLRNNAIRHLFHNRGNSQNIISLTLLFILTFYSITTSLWRSSSINPVSRIALVLIIVGSEYAMFRDNIQDLVDMFQGPNFPTITFPGQHGGGTKPATNKKGIQAVNLSISFPKNATQAEIMTFYEEFFVELFNPKSELFKTKSPKSEISKTKNPKSERSKTKVFRIVKTIITLPDVEFNMDGVHESDFYKELLQFNDNHMKSNSSKKKKKHAQPSMSTRTRSNRSSKSSRSSRSQSH